MMNSFQDMKTRRGDKLKGLVDKMMKESNKNGWNDNRFWEPEVDKSGNGYAVIRFLPTTSEGDLPYVKVFNHGFKIGTRWFIENCPTTIEQPCPVCQENSKLWITEIRENQDKARQRKRQARYISNIFVLSDPKHPENEGKVFLFKYGEKIFSKITNCIKPEFEDEESFNPFDFWDRSPLQIEDYQSRRV